MAASRTALAFAALLASACGEPGGPAEAPPVTEARDEAPDPRSEARQRLRERENTFLHRQDPSRQPPWSERSGPNPHLLRAHGDGFVGLLRGASALVALDAAGHEQLRTAGPQGAVGWSWPREDEVWVVGERSSAVHVVQIAKDGPRPTHTYRVAGVAGLRDIAVTPRGIFVADRHRSRVLRLERSGPKRLDIRASAACPGAVSVEVVADVLVANCLLAHQVRLWPLTDVAGIEGEPVVIEHDGPLWAVASRAATASDHLWVAVAGVEDHPLDRSRGGFGFIDSFVAMYEVAPAQRTAQRTWTRNVGELGVITPKWIGWQGERILVSGAGGHALALLDPSGRAAPRLREVPWGMTTVAGTFDAALAADPLLDAWIGLDAPAADAPRWRTESVRSAAAAPTPSAEARLGEALLFTSMMAPQGSSEDHASRFTCETCHFEGTVDGRTHSTGRGDVHATTKTLRGLIGNRPHFSRALDRNSMDMIHSEFRVANHGTGQSPWFSIDPAATPWFEWPQPEPQGPEALRAAAFVFLSTLSPERNPATSGRSEFTAAEQSGAALFAKHCAGCHAPLRQADDPTTAVKTAGWEAAVLGGPRLVWGSEPRVDVGIEPAVHDEGPRTPSLRNLWAKRPYFTNGSAATVGDVLERVRLEPSFSHDGAPVAGGATAPGLSRQERDDLERFVDLL